MDRTNARWRFEHFGQGYGLRITLQNPTHHGIDGTSGIAVVMEDRTADQMYITLRAVEEMYEALPEPTPPAPKSDLIILEDA